MKNITLISGGLLAGYILYKQTQKFKKNVDKVLDFDIQAFYDDFYNNPDLLNPDMYKDQAVGYAHLMSDSAAKQYAIAIYENLDSPEIIYYVFKQIPSRVQLSQVADVYQGVSPETTGNLHKDLLEALSTKEIAYLNYIIKQKGISQ